MLLPRMHVASGRITPQMWLTRDARRIWAIYAAKNL